MSVCIYHYLIFILPVLYVLLYVYSVNLVSPCSVLCRRIANCSHWVQQDHPDTVNQLIREFVASK